MRIAVVKDYNKYVARTEDGLLLFALQQYEISGSAKAMSFEAFCRDSDFAEPLNGELTYRHGTFFFEYKPEKAHLYNYIEELLLKKYDLRKQKNRDIAIEALRALNRNDVLVDREYDALSREVLIPDNKKQRFQYRGFRTREIR